MGMTRRRHVVCSPGRSVSSVNRVVQLTSYPETIEEEGSEVGSPWEEDPAGQMDPDGKPSEGGLESPTGGHQEQRPPEGAEVAPAPESEAKDAAEIQKRRRLEQAGIKVLPAAQRFARSALQAGGWPGWPGWLAWLAWCMPGGGWNLSGVLQFPSCFSTSAFQWYHCALVGATGNS